MTISWIVATADLCWVSPIAQQTIVRSDATSHLERLDGSSGRSPVAARSSSTSSRRRWGHGLVQPVGVAVEEVMVDLVGVDQPAVQEL